MFKTEETELGERHSICAVLRDWGAFLFYLRWREDFLLGHASFHPTQRNLDELREGFTLSGQARMRTAHDGPRFRMDAEDFTPTGP